MSAGGESRAKTPWYKKWWIWAIVAAVLIIGAISSSMGGGEAEPEPTPTETVVVDTTEEAPAPDDTTEEEPAVDDAQRSAEFEQAIKDALGVTEFSDLFVQDPSLWGGWISGVRVEGTRAYVTLQVASDDEFRDDFGERAATALSTLLPSSAVEGIDWIIVEDAGNVVIDQEQPAPLS